MLRVSSIFHDETLRSKLKMILMKLFIILVQEMMPRQTNGQVYYVKYLEISSIKFEQVRKFIEDFQKVHEALELFSSTRYVVDQDLKQLSRTSLFKLDCKITFPMDFHLTLNPNPVAFIHAFELEKSNSTIPYNLIALTF